MTTLNDILNAPTVNTALALANAYAMTEYGLMGDAKTQFVNENFPDLVLQSQFDPVLQFFISIQRILNSIAVVCEDAEGVHLHLRLLEFTSAIQLCELTLNLSPISMFFADLLS